MASFTDDDGFSFLTATFELVTVRVGQDEVEIPVYRELLSSVSPYFRNAFDGRFKEAMDGTIPLPDTSEATFRIFLLWTHEQFSKSGRLVDASGPSILLRATRIAGQDGFDSGEPEDHGILSDSTASASDNNTSTSDKTASNSDEYNEGQPRLKGFDEPGYKSFRTRPSPWAAFFSDNEIWVKREAMCMMSYLNVYIFADKYNVPQLRDDIMTTVLGQTHMWNRLPDPTHELLSRALGHLPQGSKFYQFLVDGTAPWALLSSDLDPRVRLERLSKWDPEFAWELSLTHASMSHAVRSGHCYGHFDYFAKMFKNSCSLHEHAVHHKTACRARIMKKAHVFMGLMDACAKNGITMVKEQEDKEKEDKAVHQVSLVRLSSIL